VEGPAECAQAADTDVEANVRYAPIRGTQEKHRAFDAPALEIAVRGLAERRAEGADEVRLGHLSGWFYEKPNEWPWEVPNRAIAVNAASGAEMR
jgi:hypothetical protein